jgi:hypothetical protein
VNSLQCRLPSSLSCYVRGNLPSPSIRNIVAQFIGCPPLSLPGCPRAPDLIGDGVSSRSNLRPHLSLRTPTCRGVAIQVPTNYTWITSGSPCLAMAKSEVPDESGNYKNLERGRVLYEIMRRTIIQFITFRWGHLPL